MIIDASRLFISRSTTVVSTAESRLTAIGQSILDNVQTIPSHVQGVMK